MWNTTFLDCFRLFLDFFRLEDQLLGCSPSFFRLSRTLERGACPQSGLQPSAGERTGLAAGAQVG